MHGSYTHRITCNLYPVQYYTLDRAAERAKMRLAPYVRDAALAYVQQKIVLPPELESNLSSVQQEVRRISIDLHQIATRANTLQRITHGDLKRAGRLIKMLDQQVLLLRNEIHSLPVLPHDRQINGS